MAKMELISWDVGESHDWHEEQYEETTITYLNDGTDDFAQINYYYTYTTSNAITSLYETFSDEEKNVISFVEILINIDIDRAEGAPKKSIIPRMGSFCRKNENRKGNVQEYFWPCNTIIYIRFGRNRC